MLPVLHHGACQLALSAGEGDQPELYRAALA